MKTLGTIVALVLLAVCQVVVGRIDMFGDDRYIDKFIPDEPVAPWLGIVEYCHKEIRNLIQEGEGVTDPKRVNAYLDKVQERLDFIYKVVAPLAYESMSPLGQEAGKTMGGHVERAQQFVKDFRSRITSEEDLVKRLSQVLDVLRGIRS